MKLIGPSLLDYFIVSATKGLVVGLIECYQLVAIVIVGRCILVSYVVIALDDDR